MVGENGVLWLTYEVTSRVQPPILAMAHIAKFGDQM